MKLNFVKLSPTQNMTILVTDPLPRTAHGAVAEQLMAYGSVGAEQVGYIEQPSLSGVRARLQMMGGEFCGNASMSLAAYLAYLDKLPDGHAASYPLEVSGAADIVACQIERRGDHYLGSVCMPLPERIGALRISAERSYPLVCLPGIAHAIVPASEMTPEEAEAGIAGWCADCGVEALGILLLSDDLSAFQPLVYVRSTGSSVWEHGCGSGTAAIGACLATQRREALSLSLSQPGGVMQVQACWDGAAGCLRELKISGLVKIAAIGQAWVEMSGLG